MARSPSIPEQIRLELARRIVQRDILPGTRLDERQLAAEFGVSRTPVREALRMLVSSGLVSQRAHRKTIVTKPDRRALAGMFAVMAYLESLSAGLCAIAMNPRERFDLERMHNDMAALVRAGDTVGYTLANEAFHNAIYDGTGNEYLAEISRHTRLRVQPFRRAQFATLGRLSASHAEHSAVVEAILRGDRNAAEAGMKAHIGLVEDAWYVYAEGIQEETEAATSEES